MRWRRDDSISVLAIAWGAAVSVGLTVAFLARPAPDPAPISLRVPMEVELSKLTVMHVPLEYGPVIPDGYRGPVVIREQRAVVVRGTVRDQPHK